MTPATGNHTEPTGAGHDGERDPDREVCVCFHVPLGKLSKFVRLTRPRVASQMSECYGAGTGCGWCVPFLERIFEQSRRGEEPTVRMSGEEYRTRRELYRATGQRDGEQEARGAGGSHRLDGLDWGDRSDTPDMSDESNMSDGSDKSDRSHRGEER